MRFLRTSQVCADKGMCVYVADKEKADVTCKPKYPGDVCKVYKCGHEGKCDDKDEYLTFPPKAMCPDIDGLINATPSLYLCPKCVSGPEGEQGREARAVGRVLGCVCHHPKPGVSRALLCWGPCSAALGPELRLCAPTFACPACRRVRREAALWLLPRRQGPWLLQVQRDNCVRGRQRHQPLHPHQ